MAFTLPQITEDHVLATRQINAIKKMHRINNLLKEVKAEMAAVNAAAVADVNTNAEIAATALEMFNFSNSGVLNDLVDAFDANLPIVS